MKKNWLRTLIVAGIATVSAMATAQLYPMEFNISPSTTNVDFNTTFYVDVVARTTDGLNHDLSLANIVVRWSPTFYAPLDNGIMDPWYVPKNGFTSPLPALPINGDGSQIGVIGGNNLFAPANIPITPVGVSLFTMRFRSTAANGKVPLDNLDVYGTGQFMMEYNEGANVHILYAQDIAGLNGGSVQVGPVPEPASMASLAVGAIAILVRRRRAK